MIDKGLYDWIRKQKGGDVQKVTFDIEKVCARFTRDWFMYNRKHAQRELMLDLPVRTPFTDRHD